MQKIRSLRTIRTDTHYHHSYLRTQMERRQYFSQSSLTPIHIRPYYRILLTMRCCWLEVHVVVTDKTTVAAAANSSSPSSAIFLIREIGWLCMQLVYKFLTYEFIAWETSIVWHQLYTQSTSMIWTELDSINHLGNICWTEMASLLYQETLWKNEIELKFSRRECNLPINIGVTCWCSIEVTGGIFDTVIISVQINNVIWLCWY